MNESLESSNVYGRSDFIIPDHVTYFAGNSLGPCLKNIPETLMTETTQRWGEGIEQGWKNVGWLDAPQRVGDKLAKLVGVPKGTSIVTDSTSVNLYKLTCAALQAKPERQVVLVEEGIFPTDAYIIQGIQNVQRNLIIKQVSKTEIMQHLDDTVACLLLSHVDYQTGYVHDMLSINAAAKEVDALTLWDISHSIGILDLDLTSCDMAVGCGYKYLNGGPGSPAFMYVNPELVSVLNNPIWGWFGHSNPFSFELEFKGASDTSKFLVGTPTILSLLALETSVDYLNKLGMHTIEKHAQTLKQEFIQGIEPVNGEQIEILGGKESQEFGSHLVFHALQASGLSESLSKQNIQPQVLQNDCLRFAFNPLFLNAVDIHKTCKVINHFYLG